MLIRNIFVVLQSDNNEKKHKMKTIKATTVLKVAKSRVISNAIKFTHNEINYSVIYDKDFFLQAVNERGEYKVIARIING